MKRQREAGMQLECCAELHRGGAHHTQPHNRASFTHSFVYQYRHTEYFVYHRIQRLIAVTVVLQYSIHTFVNLLTSKEVRATMNVQLDLKGANAMFPAEPFDGRPRERPWRPNCSSCRTEWLLSALGKRL